VHAVHGIVTRGDHNVVAIKDRMLVHIETDTVQSGSSGLSFDAGQREVDADLDGFPDGATT